MCNDSLYVKFRPFDDNLLTSLMNKTLWFSTVYDFNDFGEFSLCSPGDPDNPENLEKYLKNRRLMHKILSNCTSAKYTRKFTEDFKEWYYEKNNELTIEDAKNYLEKCGKEYRDQFSPGPFIYENIVYASLGILSLSSSHVFDTAAAMLMLAHYGDNAKGVALIYEVKKDKIHTVNYNCSTGPQSINEQTFNFIMNESYMDLKKEDMAPSKEDMAPFLTKHCEWAYEKEHRIFFAPGALSKDSALSENITLKAILYTGRLTEEKLEALKNINTCIYEDKLKIQEIYQNHSRPDFSILKADNTGDPVSEWLKTL